MTKLALILVLAASVNSCIGNLLLKQSRLVSPPDAGLIEKMLNLYFIAGVGFYGVNVLFFAKALDTAPVSVAYPILAAFGFVVLTISSWFLFNEPVTPVKIAGFSLIIGGIFLLSNSA